MKVDEHKDDIEARIRKDDHAQFEDQDEVEIRHKDNSKPYQHCQRYNSTSSMSSRASSSVSVLTGTTEVISVSASDVDVDEHHSSKVVNQEASPEALGLSRRGIIVLRPLLHLFQQRLPTPLPNPHQPTRTPIHLNPPSPSPSPTHAHPPLLLLPQQQPVFAPFSLPQPPPSLVEQVAVY